MIPRPGLWALATLAGCGGAPCETPLPVAMTPARARALDPGIEQGIAVSTARDLGPCVAGQAPLDGCDPVCGVVRRSTMVWVLRLGDTSVPVDTGCPSGLSVETARALAEVEARTGAAGEAVLRLDPGLYRLGFARPGEACVRCGAVEGDGGCRVAVERGQISVRALVF